MSRAEYNLEEDEDVVMVGPEDIHGFNTDNVLPLSAHDLTEIRKWLQPTQYDRENSEFHRHAASHLPGTGSWLTSSSIYREWHEGNKNGLLWIKGIPGSGKSVIAASLINILCKEGCPVIYFFFRQIIDANHKPTAALRDWLDQVLRYSPPLQKRLKAYCEEGQTIENLSMSDLWKDLRLAIGAFPKVYCIVDALDEMDQGNDHFLHELVELGNWRPSNIKVLITSRPVATVERALGFNSMPQLRLEEQLVDIDIVTYVQQRLKSSNVPREYYPTVKEAVPGRANGLFLYAKLAMDSFVEPNADVQEVHKTLPMDLNVMYTNLLREHAIRSQVPRDIQLLIIQFVTHATRPLRLLEIVEMISKAINQYGNGHKPKVIKDLVRVACGPLIEVLPDETVSVVHHSFTEFLKGLTRHIKPHSPITDEYIILRPGPTNKDLAMACLSYLEAGCLDNWNPTNYPKRRGISRAGQAIRPDIKLKNPFLEYAIRNWGIHVRRADLADMDMTDLYRRLDYLFAKTSHIQALLDMDWPVDTTENVTVLHIAARAGLTKYVAHLLSREEFDVNAKDGYKKSPLFWAVFSGYSDTVRLFINQGGLSDKSDNVCVELLHLAAMNNFGDIVRIILDAGVDPLIRKKRSRCYPFKNACESGCIDAVSAFILHIKDIDIAHMALSWAAGRGQSEVVARIMEYPGLDVNVKYLGNTPLFDACRNRDQKTISILLEAGADPTVFSNPGRCDEQSQSGTDKQTRGFTPLHAFCGLGGRSWGPLDTGYCIELLIQAGADVHQKAPDGSTALFYASQHFTHLIKPLLAAGADPNVADDWGDTPLHVLKSKDLDILSCLFGRCDVDINKPRKSDGKSPLLCRLSLHPVEEALALLEYAPDVHATDYEGNGPLHIVLSHLDITDNQIQALLAAGADPNLKNKKGQTPLHVMIGPNSELIDILLDAGADLEACDNEGQTPLFKILSPLENSRFNTGPIREKLIQRGARLEIRDLKGRTILHQVVHKKQYLVKHLIGLGLDQNVIDYEGNTLFHEIIANGDGIFHPVIVDDEISISEGLVSRTKSEIRELAIVPNQTNYHGRNALHMVCANLHENINSTNVIENSTAKLDFVLDLCKEIDCADNQGIRPLHLAATISEGYVYRLLAAGADLLGATYQGMTVLHLSSRTRQVNTVGLILSEILNLNAEKRMKFINHQNDDGKTALHYACRSGRPETVKLLLEAGADPSLQDRLGRSPLESCAEFDEELELWGQYRTRNMYGAGIDIGDNNRPVQQGLLSGPLSYLWTKDPRRIDARFLSKIPHSCIAREDDTVRLDEILDLLVQYDARIKRDPTPLINAIAAAKSMNAGYSLQRLLKLESRIGGTNTIEKFESSDLCILDSIFFAQSKRDAIRSSEFFKSGSKESSWSIFGEILRLREFELLKELINEGFDLQRLNEAGKSVLHSLSIWGYANILKDLCTVETARGFDDYEWCKGMDEGRTPEFILLQVEPLLLAACKRKLPNMDVIKVLVEKISVNLDAQARCEVDDQPVASQGCLHELACGRHWWQVMQALPYLVEKGASLELRDEMGRTPLHIALSSKEVFSKEASVYLIEAGADVNAATYKNDTSLSMAGTNVEMVKMLLSHGAKVTADSIFAAIDINQPEILKSLLAQGSYANLTVRFESYPLQHAASLQLGINSIEYMNTPSTEVIAYRLIQTHLMKILLDYGADIYAEFYKDVPQTRHTVVHEIIEHGVLVKPILNIASLEIERRDPSGCTLLLAACKRRQREEQHEADTIDTAYSVFQHLCSRGADLTVCDHQGCNIFHHLVVDLDLCEFLEHAVRLVPHLLQKADHNGNTPFHYALRDGKLPVIEFLFQQGVDSLKPDSEGNTALHFLANRPEGFTGNVERLFHVLVNQGIPINDRNKSGETALFAFVKNCLFGWVGSHGYAFAHERKKAINSIVPVIQQFRDAGADIFARSNSGSTLLHLLASSHVGEEAAGCFKHLVDLGLDPMAEDNSQRTSLDVAAACENSFILRLFERESLEV
ncbi:ankyrin repeat-containing domain protein [Talaromyces proteolyticus]|uniref:Ankyrin repeat-containing domain protein n=1 Tax=Talaromyces proteolyticus TaxID=1131652 RepID=A0AAD4KIY8_9EURO|nr:ankyrin repeat-containing domain protein [Talaromyces proteolyticus]KAH8692272.1 ankyrin repeat-containing domain protein [Talaromyces proteolyticus]